MSDTVAAPTRLRLPSLALALAVMIAGTVYPPLMTDAAGRADHGIATALLLAMSAGFVHGLGFVPRRAVWRALFSGWTVLAALAAAALLRFAT